MNKFPIYPKYEGGDYCGYEFDPHTDFTDVSPFVFLLYIPQLISSFYLLFSGGGRVSNK